MRILGQEAITRRRAAGSRTAAGVVDTAELTDATIYASVQPVGKQHVQWPQRTVFTTSELRVADPEAGVRADQVLLDGRPFDVLEVHHHRAVLPHYQATVEREGWEIVTISTPNAAPTIDNAAGTVTPLTVDTTISTARIRKLTLEEVAGEGGPYQLGDVELALKVDELPISPTTDTTWTDATGTRHAVLTVDRDLKRLMWVLTSRRIA